MRHWGRILLDVDSETVRENFGSGWLLDAASEMTSSTRFKGDVALNKSVLGPVLFSFATHRDLTF